MGIHQCIPLGGAVSTIAFADLPTLYDYLYHHYSSYLGLPK
jgi:hypothetical protein